MGIGKSSLANALTADSLIELAFGLQKSRILLSAYELGVFSALGDENKTSSDVARALDTPERATDRLMNALCAIGLLEKKEGQFSNTPLTARYLVKGKPEFIAGMAHMINLWNTWSTLTEAVRRGKTLLEPDINKRDSEWLATLIAATHERACRQAPTVTALLDLSGVSRVLDVGGGSGAYAAAFVQAKEGITATILDLPNVLPLTRRYIDTRPFSHKITTVAGDFNVDDLGSGFDLVFLSAILHNNPVEQNRNLMRKCASALNPRGQVVVQDFIMDEDRTAPVFGAIFALNMLVATEAGDTYTESEVRTWMEEAGLSNITRKDTFFNTTLIMGRKI